jgi:hypothetical protein
LSDAQFSFPPLLICCLDLLYLISGAALTGKAFFSPAFYANIAKIINISSGISLSLINLAAYAAGEFSTALSENHAVLETKTNFRQMNF